MAIFMAEKMGFRLTTGSNGESQSCKLTAGGDLFFGGFKWVELELLEIFPVYI